jgi:serine/threonine protein kinase/WD40 repeat protein
MTPEPPPSPDADAIFRGALERLLPEERAAFLDEACAGDATLRAAVETRLEDYKREAAAERALAPLSEGPGDFIGRYKLVEKIGEGGGGVVFRAEQSEPVRRSVALKVIRLGMDTAEVVARFEAERQALALMEHPHIARVLDAGATPGGRPFFVMELVRGEPITKFCDGKQLPLAQRLELFAQVCQAVQHAHQKGVVHRDLKPSNILVSADDDGTPAPKVIDFGIAKATAARLTDRTFFTSRDQFVGTPAYMSPEQAEPTNLDVDTRADIYSLGVLLYELLTGQLPIDPENLRTAGVDEIRRQIREVDPPPPSARLATLDPIALADAAGQRGTETSRLRAAVRGDLDWIVMRCLEKDRARRYDSAGDLAQDLARHLAHEPVAARPPSKLYLLQKLVRRHRVAFTAAAAVLLALTVGFGVALRSYLSEREARRAAEDAQSATRVALARSDYQRAIGLLDDPTGNKAPEAVAHLVRALRARPDDRAASMLLASVLTQRDWAVRIASTSVSQPFNFGGQGGGFPARGNNRGGLNVPPRGGQPGRGGQGQRGGRGPVRIVSNTARSDILSLDGKLVLHDFPQDDAVRLFTVSASATSPERPAFEPMRLAGNYRSASFKPDGRHLVTTSEAYDPETRRTWLHEETWELSTQPALLLTLTLPKPDERAPRPQPPAFSADGRAIVFNNRAWDAASGQPLTTVPPATTPSLGLSPDGKRSVNRAPRGGGAIVTDVASGAVLLEFARDAGQLETAIFSPDSTRIATTTGNGTARVWDAATGEPVSLPMQQGEGALRARFSPDGTLLLTYSPDGSAARVWDAATGLPVSALIDPERISTALSPFPGAGGTAHIPAFSPDGRWVLTPGKARVWDALTGLPVSMPFVAAKREPPATPQPPLNPEVPTVLAFSPDGRRLLAYEQADGRPLRVWPSGDDAPAWLPDLAEALARLRLDATGSAEFTTGEKSLAELKRLVAAEPDKTRPLVIWARRLLGLDPPASVGP